MTLPSSQSAIWKLLAIGVVGGLVGGGLGVGGGIVLVPLLIAFGFERHRAHATSLAAIILIALAGAASFGLSGESDLRLGIVIGLGGVVGSIAGASAMHRMSARALSVVFGVVLLIAAIRMITGANPLPGSNGFDDFTRILISLGIGLIAGFFAGVAGVGGGAIIVPAAVFFLDLPQHQAQGTSLTAIVLTAVAATAVNRRNDRVRPMDGFIVGAGGVVGSIVGSRIALVIEGRTLSLIFGFMILFIGLRTLYRAYGRQPQEVGVD